MPASFPGAVKAFTTRSNGQTIDASHIDDLQDEVTAIESGYLTGTAPISASNASFHNLSVSGSLSASVGSTFASSLTIGTVPYVFPSSGGSTGQALVIASASGSTLTLAWQSVSNNYSLVKANSGTADPNVTANLDTIALTGLTVKDRLIIDVILETDQNAVMTIASATDANGTICNMGTLAGSNSGMWHIVLANAQSATTKYGSLVQSQQQPGATTQNTYLSFTATTAWTGSWTLALRNTSGSVGGTLRWSWSVYKLAGQ